MDKLCPQGSVIPILNKLDPSPKKSVTKQIKILSLFCLFLTFKTKLLYKTTRKLFNSISQENVQNRNVALYNISLRINSEHCFTSFIAMQRKIESGLLCMLGMPGTTELEPLIPNYFV